MFSHQPPEPRPTRPGRLRRAATAGLVAVGLVSLASSASAAQDDAAGLHVCYDLACNDRALLEDGMLVSEQIFGLRWYGDAARVTFDVNGSSRTERISPFDGYGTNDADGTSQQQFHRTGDYTVSVDTNTGVSDDVSFTVTKLVACLDPACDDKVPLEGAELAEDTFGIRWLGRSGPIEFSLDGSVLRTERYQPYDAYGTGPDDISYQRAHSPGPHTVVAAKTTGTGDTFDATFTIGGANDWTVQVPPTVTVGEGFTAKAVAGSAPAPGTWSLPDGPYPRDRQGVDLVSLEAVAAGEVSITPLLLGPLDLAFTGDDGRTETVTVNVTHPSGLQPDDVRTARYGPGRSGNPTVLAGAMQVAPADDLAGVVNRAGPNTTFYLKAGVHRLTRTLSLKSGQQLIGATGAEISGGVVATGPVQSVDGVFRISEGIPVLPAPSSDHAGKCAIANSGCQLPQQLFVGDRQLTQVADRSAVVGETFHYDNAAGVITFGLRPQPGETVEYTVNTNRMIQLADRVTINNLVVKRWAGGYQTTSVGGPADAHGVVITNSRFHQLSGAAVGLPSQSRFEGNIISEAGQLGLNASGTRSNKIDDVRIIANRMEANNFDNWKWVVEAGATKFSRVTDLVARGNHLVDNNGAGLWSDTSNVNHLYEFNVADDNYGDSFFYEISWDGTIRYNEARQSGSGGWPIDDTGAAVTVSESHDVDVYSNRLLDNNAGVNLKQVRCRGLYSDNYAEAAEWYLSRVVVAGNKIRQRDYGLTSGSWPDGKAIKVALDQNGTGPDDAPCPRPYSAESGGAETWSLADWYRLSNIMFTGNSFELFDADGNPDDGTTKLFWDYDDRPDVNGKAELTLSDWIGVVNRRQ